MRFPPQPLDSAGLRKGLGVEHDVLLYKPQRCPHAFAISAVRLQVTVFTIPEPLHCLVHGSTTRGTAIRVRNSRLVVQKTSPSDPRQPTALPQNLEASLSQGGIYATRALQLPEQVARVDEAHEHYHVGDEHAHEQHLG